MKQLAPLFALLLAACGPSEEAVECCECLVGPDTWELVEQDDGWHVDMTEVSRNECPVALAEGRLIASVRSWRPGESWPDGVPRASCHEKCAAHLGDLELAQERAALAR